MVSEVCDETVVFVEIAEFVESYDFAICVVHVHQRIIIICDRDFVKNHTAPNGIVGFEYLNGISIATTLQLHIFRNR